MGIMDQVMLKEDGTLLYLIHLVVALDNSSHIACMPVMDLDARPSGTYPFRRTDDLRAVTCPSCLASEDYRKKKEHFERVLALGRMVF